MSTQQLSGSVVGGHYRLEAPLGSGGFGTVHRAVDVRIDRPVAVKLLRRELMGSGDVEARFMREAELARRLEHPNTVRLVDFGRADGTPFLVYELLVGESLGELLAREGALPVERVTHIGMQLLKSLSEAHTLGIVHRDIKPANIFLTNFAGASDFVKVLDFGIAKAPAEQMTVLTQTGVTIGTPSYMAPEQVRSQPVGPAADLYAVGLVLAEALTGRVIVWNQTPLLTAMEQIAERPVPLPPEVIASKLAPVLQRATHKSVEYRYGSAQQMLADLEAAAAGLLTAQIQPSPMAQAPTAPRGNPFAAHALAPVHARPHAQPAYAQPSHVLHAQPVYAQSAAPRTTSTKGVVVALLVVVSFLLIGGIVAASFWLRDNETAATDNDRKPRKRETEPTTKPSGAEVAPASDTSATVATPSQPTSLPPSTTAPTGSPVKSGGVPAKCAEVCTRLGHCTASGDRCIVGSDADCRGSNQCSGLGKCVKAGDACAARSESDCRNASQCRTAGVCTHVANINVCLATKKADCEASTRCKTDGACSAGSGSCVPLTEAECQASQRCKTEGICSLAGNSCVKK